jgi:hypothetical protein
MTGQEHMILASEARGAGALILTMVGFAIEVVVGVVIWWTRVRTR